MNLGTCLFCRKPVESTHSHALKVSGWEVVRPKGLNALYDKQRTPDLIAHETCLKHPPGQESFAA